jgi:hypothetical protein
MVELAATQAWEAAGYFRLARRWEECGDYRRARVLYFRVLDRVPDHVPALLNLAVTELRRGSPKAALARLDQLDKAASLDQLTEAPSLSLDQLDEAVPLTSLPNAEAWPELAYAALYNRAAALEGIGKPVEAALRTSALCSQVLGRLAVLDAGSRRLAPFGRVRESGMVRPQTTASETPEGRLLMRLELPVLIFHAGLIVTAIGPQDKRLADRAVESALDDKPSPVTRETLYKLVASPVVRPGSEEATRVEPLFSRKWPVYAEWYARPRAADVRAHYNLACYCSRLARIIVADTPNLYGADAVAAGPRKPAMSDVERLVFRAFEHLGTAFTDRSLLEWAQVDPALATVREHPGWGDFVSAQRREVEPTVGREPSAAQAEDDAADGDGRDAEGSTDAAK